MAVAAVLADYPEETIRYVTDPRSGLPARKKRDPRTGNEWTGLPDVADVKAACEEHHAPMQRALERDARARKQLEEREMLALTDGRPRKTYEEIVADCRKRGLMIGGERPRGPVVAIDAYLAENGISREQFDALPDLPKSHGDRFLK